MSVSTIEIALVLLLTFCLLVLVRRLASVGRRPEPIETSDLPGAPPRSKHKLGMRITPQVRTQRVVLDGIDVSDPQSISDPLLRQALAQAEEALHDVNQGRKPRAGLKSSVSITRKFVINGVEYNDPSEIPDPKLRQVAQDAIKQALS
jgi:hypothetical protein